MGDQALQNAHRLRDEAVARLDRAKADLAQAQEAIAVAKADLEKVNGFITLWHSFADYDRALSERAEDRLQEVLPAGSAPKPAPEAGREPRRGKRPRGNPKKEIVGQISRSVIREHGAPIMRTALFAAVRDRGLEIKGADPEMVFSTMLWRVPNMVTRLPDFGYWLSERPYEPAGYVPGVQRTMIDKEEYDMTIADGTGQLPDIDSDDQESDTGAHGTVDNTTQRGPDAVTELREKVTAAKHAYDQDRPYVSDAQYDEWRRQLTVIETSVTTHDKVMLGPPRPVG